MTDKEKVLKGMVCCMIAPGSCSDECPYRGQGDATEYCNDKIIKDVYTLLKAQEARLVTYDDFHSGREDGGEAIPCWKESRKKTRRSGWAVIVYGKMLADLETGVARYWTARPTEEQMREEAWPIMK